MTSRDPRQPSTAPAHADDANGGRGVGRSLATIVELTGLTADEIREGFRADPPKTLAEQAGARGVSQDELVAATVADTRRRIGEAVAAGTITRDQADERLGSLEANVVELVTTIPFRGDRRLAAIGIA